MNINDPPNAATRLTICWPNVKLSSCSIRTSRLHADAEIWGGWHSVHKETESHIPCAGAVMRVHGHLSLYLPDNPPRWISIVKAYLINFWYDNKTGSLFGSLYGIFLKRLLYAQFQINDVWIRGCLVLLYPDADIQHFKARCRDSLSDVRDALGEQREDPFPCSIDVSLLLNNTFHDFLPFYCWYGTPSTT